MQDRHAFSQKYDWFGKQKDTSLKTQQAINFNKNKNKKLDSFS